MKTYIFCLLWIMAGFASYAQVSETPVPLIDRVARQLRVFPKEKIHTHIDRFAYVPGDTLWFRNYVVHSTFHTPLLLSNYVYTELINPFGQVIERVRIRKDDNLCYRGYIPLSPYLPAGNYTLRTYTKYMVSDSANICFTRDVRILPSPVWHGIKTRLSIIPNERQRAKVQVRVENANGSMESLGFKKGGIKISEQDKPKMRRFSETVEEEIKKKEIAEAPSFLLQLEDKNERMFERFLPFSTQREDYELTFYPEGGYLLSGDTCRVAFKALDKSGNDASVRLALLEGKDTLVTAGTFHAGMGSFEFLPQIGRRYKVETVNDIGLKRTFQLPEVREEAAALRVEEDDGVFCIHIRAHGKRFARGMRLIVHIRGAILYDRTFDALPLPNEAILLRKETCPAGVIQCLLLDNEGRSVSERLCFVPYGKTERIDVHLQSDKKIYASRELVQIGMQLKDYTGAIAKGTMSVAITDGGLGIVDTLYHLPSTLALTSELKGCIAEPAFYLQRTDSARITADLLMLTHGWRRYDLAAIARKEIKKPSTSPETQGMMEGRVSFKKKLQKGEYALMRMILPETGSSWNFPPILPDTSGWTVSMCPKAVPPFFGVSVSKP